MKSTAQLGTDKSGKYPPAAAPDPCWSCPGPTARPHTITHSIAPKLPRCHASTGSSSLGLTWSRVDAFPFVPAKHLAVFKILPNINPSIPANKPPHQLWMSSS